MINRRLRALLRKEFLQVWRDPSSIAIAFVLPVFLLLLFGFGVSMDARHVPLGVVVERPSSVSESLVAAFRHSDYFAPRPFLSRQAGEAALQANQVNGLLILPQTLDEQLSTGQGAGVQLLLNGVDSNSARLLQGYVRGVFEGWLARQQAARGRAGATVEAQPRIWFNPELRSRNYLVPGLMVINMTLVGALLTALVMAREWERGTLEALMVTPVTLREILIGKTLPYFTLGMGGMLLSAGLSILLFEVPLRGSLWALILFSALFMLTALGMGLLISVVAKNQFVAGMAAIVSTFLPAFLLSGFLFDIDSMPWVVQLVTHIVAARYFVTILQTLFLAGDVWGVILPNAAALSLLATLFFGLARRQLHKRLE